MPFVLIRVFRMFTDIIKTIIYAVKTFKRSNYIRRFYNRLLKAFLNKS
jgi:hypothetical protein